MHRILLVAAIFLIACDPSSNSTQLTKTSLMTPQRFTIKLGISPEEYITLNGLNTKANVDEQPAGLNFYEKDWPSDNRGTVYVDHGKYSFQLVNILHATGLEDTRKSDEGIVSFSLNAGGAAQSLDFHDAIRQRFLAFLQTLKAKGWERAISYSDPRLADEDAIRYLLTERSIYKSPLNYPFSLDQWMQLKNPKWRLYADNVFLDIAFSRDSKAMEPTGYGSYLFTYKVYGANEYGANHMKSNDRANWQALWVETAKALKEARYAKEAELIKKGYTIDTKYSDPKIHPADPVEP